MNKIILPALVFLLAAGISVFGQQAASGLPAPDFTDETTIILDDTAGTVEDNAETRTQFFTTWDFVKVILILAAVILIVYAIFFALKKAGGAKFQNEDLIRLLSSRSLTQNASVHLIEVGQKYYLVGCGEDTVSHIADIEDKETIDEIILKNPPPAEGKKTFADFFNLKSGHSGSGKSELQSKIRNNSKFMHNQAERLKKM